MNSQSEQPETPRGALILIVEDEPAIADTIDYALRTEGFHTAHVTTGQAGIDAVAAGDPQLVVLDVGLPDLSGFDVCRQIRRNSDIPIIFLTARSDEIDRIVGLEIGADDYMVKPFSPRELAVRVRIRLKSAGTNASPANGSNGFVVDEARAQISLRDHNLDLSRYEYRILSTLIAQPGRVFSREQLLEAAWDHPEKALDRTVDTHMKTLRQKLRGIDEHRTFIRTHRGMGYSLVQ